MTITGGAVDSSPTVVNGVVYIGSDDSYLYALVADTGAILSQLLTGGAIDSSPDVIGGFVYVGSDDRRIYAFDAIPQTGSVPEPGTLALLAFSLVGLSYSRRR